MALVREHDLHRRRFGRNLGLGLTLGAFVLLLVALTMVKISRFSTAEGYAEKAAVIGKTGEGN